MPLPVRSLLGAPGIYQRPEPPLRALTGVRMDVCAFLGVAPRGPSRAPVFDERWRDDRPCVEPERPRRRTVAVAVESFEDYRRLYGGFEGPGLLPYAVASFFEQGGKRAYIARVVHEYGDAVKNAGGVAAGDVIEVGTENKLFKLLARDEGSWGNGLRAALDFTVQSLVFNPDQTTLDTLVMGGERRLTAGALLRLTLETGERALRFVVDQTRQGHPSNAKVIWMAKLDQPAPDKIEIAEIVEGVLLIDDGDGRSERHEGLGFSSDHPRWAATVLCYESQLVYPDASWIGGEITPSDPSLLPGPWSAPFDGGEDRYAEITPEDFFSDWTPGDEEPGDGVHALAQLSDLSLVVAPDLYSPAPLVSPEDILDPVSLAGPDFDRCFDLPPRPAQAAPQFDLEGLRLDPKLPGDRAKIIELQQRLVDFASLARSFIALLDVPPGLNQRQILNWRANFDSAFAAAYHPWLQVSRRDDLRNAIILAPPSAVAAGIIARQEIAFGAPHGPANVLAAEVIGVDDQVSPARHDELHPEGVNVYLRERDGVRLTAARTLSRDPAYRQLSVRRLITMIIRALDQQMQWVVFEPHNAALRAELRLALRSYLRRLFSLGAFRGATEEQAFFVRCDETNNPPYVSDAGRLIAEIGVAPSEPLEFILLRLAREGDGTLILREPS
jgi:hypothetical protein